ncbi:MAG TPA: endo-1,4-beta-xylanase [Sedimentisphaerales bacterium]|nr:endo-1,4-beta-xylanase [Sedimentisphaerales bacterium]
MARQAYLAIIIVMAIQGLCMSSEQETLRAAADSRGKLIGFAMRSRLDGPDKDQYLQVAASQFNVLVAENAMKFGELCRGSRGEYNFAEADAMVDFAKANRMKVRGHTLIWHSQQPRWLAEGTWTRDEMMQIIREHIHAVVGRYRGKVFAWDVVNEALSNSHDPNEVYRSTNFYEAIGPEYIDMAFRWAREADPDAKLFYNDYGMDFGGPKFEKMLTMVKGMQERGVPIDGVGPQMHIGLWAQGKGPELAKAIRRIAALGLEVHITEMDVAVELPCDQEKLARQAKIYGEITRVAMEEPGCTALLLWGFTDRHSWIPSFSQGRNGCALIFDEEYRPKPAYHAMLEAIRGR